eukprot:10858481-Ditylum_brightwellii.AAC.1
MEVDACWVLASTEGFTLESKKAVLCVASVDGASMSSTFCNEDGFMSPSFSKVETSRFGVFFFCASRDTG